VPWPDGEGLVALDAHNPEATRAAIARKQLAKSVFFMILSCV
jgi:hypothetical protein